ncbi:MAG TPA: LLM class flavin-dependent oxidoreductase [Caulobacteraceae bacterium]|jgi:alkanesulfonate monooxygenase SsuD/methylene tetrahydromethanopterin reductase-like flavin-dependent oxidoreductase (luciferase family)|nr:LLM class flavin-dependent oxidoreductase [Caulobacteraceae bacterium]
MKLGLFTQPLHALGRPLATVLREDREFIILADKLGYEEAFIGEHVTDAAEVITDSMTFIAWLLEETKSIKLGTGTLNLPNHHPARVAATAAMLDHMADGRFIMGISPGGLLSDAEAFGNLDANRNEMFLECINQVLEIWASEAPYEIKGKYWDVSTKRTFDAKIGQGYIHKPMKLPHPPIVVTAVAPHSQGITAAAARGWEPLSAHFVPSWIVKSHWPKYVEGCQQGGRPADPANWRVAKSIFVADDMETARHYATSSAGPYQQYYYSLITKLVGNGRANIFKTDPSMPDSSVTVEDVLDQVLIWGTPEKVADEILAFHDKIGDFGTLLYAGHDWVDRSLGIRSAELMAERVIPRVNAQLASGRAAA